MADNAPFSVNRPPFPNVVIGFNQRVDVHVATLTLAGASAPVVNQALSTAGITVANGAAGIYVISFPPGGTGAVGFAVVAAPLQATAAGIAFSVASATSSYVTGLLDLRAFQVTDGAANDMTGDVTVLIHVIKAVV